MPLKKLDLPEKATLVYTAPALAPAEAELTWVLVHGAGGLRSNWENQLPALEAQGWAAVAVDLPGHGEAQGDGSTRVEDYALAVEALIAELRPRKLVLCGHSMGGAITQRIALDGRIDLAGIVLVATGAEFPGAADTAENCVNNWGLICAGVGITAVGPDGPEDVRQLVSDRFAENDNMVVHRDFTACSTFDVTGDIANIALPTCVITGSNDFVTAPELGAYQSETIPNATLHGLEGPGHFLMQELPDVTNTILIEFGRSLL